MNTDPDHQAAADAREHAGKDRSATMARLERGLRESAEQRAAERQQAATRQAAATHRPNAELDRALVLRDTDPAAYARLSAGTRVAAAFYAHSRSAANTETEPGFGAHPAVANAARARAGLPPLPPEAA